MRVLARLSRSGRPGQAGFTLVELLVVLVILVLLASLVGPRVIGYLGSSRTKAAKVQIESLSSALELFKLDAGRYPSTSEGLKALVEAPSGVSAWNGPYLTKRDLPYIAWAAMPYFLAMCVAVALVWYWPGIVTWLPAQMTGPMK